MEILWVHSPASLSTEWHFNSISRNQIASESPLPHTGEEITGTPTTASDSLAVHTYSQPAVYSTDWTRSLLSCVLQWLKYCQHSSAQSNWIDPNLPAAPSGECTLKCCCSKCRWDQQQIVLIRCTLSAVSIRACRRSASSYCCDYQLGTVDGVPQLLRKKTGFSFQKALKWKAMQESCPLWQQLILAKHFLFLHEVHFDVINIPVFFFAQLIYF